MATGVDRVELAYLDHIQRTDCPLFALVRTAFGYVLIGPEAIGALTDRIMGRVPWGAADLMSRLPRGRTRVQMQAEADMRRLAHARATPGRLSAMLARALPAGAEYYNVGHSNLTKRVFDAVNSAGATSHVMIHDVIPLEFPQYQRPGTVAPFRDKLRRVREHAHRVIYNSEDTRWRAEAQMAEWGPVPPSIVSHLGTVVPMPDAGALPADLRIDRPYFVTVGTIEPRKNHAFLLDLWERMGSDAPNLFICGGRGWNNDAVFARLDALSDDGPVTEIANLGDPALAALAQGAAGNLFPSHAEGFGFPPIEALMLGSRVLCNDLTVLREILGQNAEYISVFEPGLWINIISKWARNPPDVAERRVFDGPKWSDHFKTVLTPS
jgi:glycosyltransferase involved in cell wall biosynthesis